MFHFYFLSNYTVRISFSLSANTLSWIESNLKHAKENNIEVIASSHHNLITHNELFESNYTLYNASALKELYAKYDVKLNSDGTANVTEIWDIAIEDTNTLYERAQKEFSLGIIDKEEYLKITRNLPR